MKKELELIASRESTAHRQRLVDLFRDSRSLMVGAFTIGMDDILAELQADFCYLACADVQGPDLRPASPDAVARVFNPAQLKERLAREQAMVRLIPAHHAKYWIAGLGVNEPLRGALFSGDLMPSALSPDEPSGNSHEILVELSTSESAELLAFARWVMYWRPAKDILPTHNQAASGSQIALPKFKQLLLTDPSRSLMKATLSLIDQAEDSIVATTWLIEEGCPIVQRLASAAKTKQVTILAHDDKTNRPALESLVSAGIKVLLCPGMHAKMLLVDAEKAPSAVVTSANLLNQGYESGLELGLHLPRGDIRLGLLQDFVARRLPFCTPLGQVAAALSKPKSVSGLKDLGQVIKVPKPVRIF
jgi:hypothetical protein